ncbi:MAG: hypothetical protein Q9220_000718 [cf. Caloplaca sp. 1 TL-2023]
MFTLIRTLITSTLLPYCAASFVDNLGTIDSQNSGSSAVLDNLTWTTGQPSSSVQGRVYVSCNSRYGAGLEGRNCFNALGKSPRGEAIEFWMQQGIIPPGITGVVGLPIITFSGTSTDDGSCVIEPALAPTFNIGQASAFNVSEAAREVIRECVLRRRVGGVGVNIGMLQLALYVVDTIPAETFMSLQGYTAEWNQL